MKRSSICVIPVLVLLFLCAWAGVGVARAQVVPEPPLPPPTNVTAVNGPNLGEVVLSWDPVAEARSYRLGWLAMEDFQAYPNVWREKFAYSDVSANSTYKVARLTSGIEYYLIVGRQDQSGHIAWSTWVTLLLDEDDTPCPGAGTTRPPDAPAPPRDYDTDDDGLIEIDNLAQLDAVRYDTNGDGVARGDASPGSIYNAAFPNAPTGMGCPTAGCIGYELMADLDFDTNGNGVADAGDDYWNDGDGWLPIGRIDFHAIDGFKASFDGNGHTISNLYVSGTGYAGLFGSVSGNRARIVGVVLSNADVTGGRVTGGLAGSLKGTITDSSVTGRVHGDGDSVGGLTGQNWGEITGSSSTAQVSANGNDVGGLVGYNSGSINVGYAAGSVNGSGNNVGGLVGLNDGDAFVSFTITASYSTADVTGAGDSVGGLVGANHGAIKAGYATGAVTGDASVGGLVGQNSFWTCFGDGLPCLSAEGTIAESYAVGEVTGSNNVGGLVGRDTFGGEGFITYSYWNMETSGQAASDGGEGKTTAELKAPTGATGIYANWDPDLWDFGTSSQYPVLKGGEASVASQR